MALRQTVRGENLLETIERCLLQAMIGEEWSQVDMAKTLKVTPSSLNARLSKLGLRPKDMKLRARLIDGEDRRRLAVVA